MLAGWVGGERGGVVLLCGSLGCRSWWFGEGVWVPRSGLLLVLAWVPLARIAGWMISARLLLGERIRLMIW